jgi:hypothetical protein
MKFLIFISLILNPLSFLLFTLSFMLYRLSIIRNEFPKKLNLFSIMKFAFLNKKILFI